MPRLFIIRMPVRPGQRKSSRVKSNGLDMLSLKAGIGTAFVKNTMVTDIGGEMGFQFQ